MTRTNWLMAGAAMAALMAGAASAQQGAVAEAAEQAAGGTEDVQTPMDTAGGAGSGMAEDGGEGEGELRGAGPTDADGAPAPTAADRGPLAGVIASEDGTVVRGGTVPEAMPGGDDAGGASTQRGADLEALAREADGARIGATDGAMAGMGAGIEMDSPARRAQVLLDLEEYGEAFFERGFRQGYVRGLQEGRASGQRAVMERMNREARMRQRAARTEAQQRQIIDGSQQPQAGAAPQFIIVPQGTDMQGLMRQLQEMQQGG